VLGVGDYFQPSGDGTCWMHGRYWLILKNSTLSLCEVSDFYCLLRFFSRVLKGMKLDGLCFMDSLCLISCLLSLPSSTLVCARVI
jgi:hypothetical protein